MGIADPKTVSLIVRKVVAEQLCIEEEIITPEAKFTTDLGADSLDMVELVMSLEREFQLEIPEEIASKIETVQDAINQICDLLNEEYEAESS